MQVWGVVRIYYRLTKPGIVYGNTLATLGGFLLASGREVRPGLLAATLIGTALVIASACVVNNYIDRGIDRKMARTSKRALAHGDIATRSALLYASILALVGFGTLMAFTNILTAGLGLFGYFAYIVLYGFAKRRTVHGTLVGSLSGAVPPAAGYTAASGSFDGGAVILFLIMAAWQMPHFYAIAIMRMKDYAAARLPVLPVKEGVMSAKRQIIGYIILFAALAGLTTAYGLTGYTFLAVMLLLSAWWLRLGLTGFKEAGDSTGWARTMFGFSLYVLLAFCIMLSLETFLP